jgi:aldehyde dehydrogenase (NAD+)
MEFRDVSYRKQRLIHLLDVLIRREKDITDALYRDFGKPEFEAVATETALVQDELKYTIKNLRSWTRSKWVWPSLINFPSTDRLIAEPYGDVLVLAPWNYPFQLAMMPVIGAVAAGNRVVLKPSEHAPHTADILSVVLNEVFDPTHVEVFTGGAEVAQKLLERQWDYIFFTGSTSVGKKVAAEAAKNLTPVTLELGGKNPCLIDRTANLEVSARRIVWGKFINAGQTCIAPDYLLVEESVVERFNSLLKAEIESAYGPDPEQSPDFARIINDGHFERLKNMLDGQNIIYGGKFNPATRYVSPTLVQNPPMESGLMGEEIFGPVLPILTYRTSDDIRTIVSRYEKPLAWYVFSEDSRMIDQIVRDYPAGGICINDTVVQYANRRLPFGGIGHSGMGAYHGKRTFDTFTHYKPVVKRATWLDLKLRYAPYEGKVNLIRRIFKWL